MSQASWDRAWSNLGFRRVSLPAKSIKTQKKRDLHYQPSACQSQKCPMDMIQPVTPETFLTNPTEITGHQITPETFVTNPPLKCQDTQ